jgi:hypothetical protein
MEGPDPGVQEEERDSRTRSSDRVVGILAIQSIALLIGIAMPLTPSKTGSTWSPAQLFWDDPSYLREVAVYFVMTNLLILGIGLVVWLVGRFDGSG